MWPLRFGTAWRVDPIYATDTLLSVRGHSPTWPVRGAWGMGCGGMGEEQGKAWRDLDLRPWLMWGTALVLPLWEC